MLVSVSAADALIDELEQKWRCARLLVAVNVLSGEKGTTRTAGDNNNTKRNSRDLTLRSITIEIKNEQVVTRVGDVLEGFFDEECK